MTAVMISRLVLNLRSVTTEYQSGPSGLNMQRIFTDQSFLTRTIGNLGEDTFVFGYSTAVVRDSEDALEVGIPLANVFKRSDVPGNIQ